MASGLFTMSTREIERLTIIQQIVEKRFKQGRGAKLLKVTPRQIRRLVRAYRRQGAQGLISKQRGQVGNHHHTEKTQEQIKQFVLSRYADFGPTFAAEKLRERHELKVNKETLRQWMMDWGIWKAKRHKKVKIHQSRTRRSCFGELVQIDGSHHDWFEGRASKCCLLVFIDDATSRLVGLHFEAGETTAGYFKLGQAYIKQYGRPLALYSDRDSIFRTSRPNQMNLENTETQFSRAMRELDIELICANSPQAKGRVERANGTLQKRLVREMRLRGISNIIDANAFLPTFVEDYNHRFAVEPSSPINAHRMELPDAATLDLIFSFQHERKLSKNLETSYDSIIYQVKESETGYRLRHARIRVCEDLTGTITLLYHGRSLNYVCHEKQKHAAQIVTSKQLEKKINALHQAVKKPISNRNHPWRLPFKEAEKPQGKINATAHQIFNV
jgi:hypothetical protein